MKKAKTRKNLFSLLSAMLGVVFALITGVTYCYNLLTFTYVTNPNSTSAYLGNQQYVMINDTIDCPIAFGEGTHNFEIAMQYSISYDFDVRLKYSMKWSNNADVGNVILHFADKDNVIYDDEYIFLANPVPAGDGRIGFITGLDFVDVTDSNYFGQNLTITIVSEKIYKAQTEYDKTHYLYVDAISTKTASVSLAADMWLAYKPKTKALAATIDLNKANVLLYNYRSSYENGIPYSGHQTAYKRKVKSTKVGENTVYTTTSSTWLGGNESYAGTGMYIVTGDKAIKLTIKVEGVWYSSAGVVNSSDLISENSIKYHYAEGWTHQEWFNNKMWEERSFDYVIPENSACYIDILDSIEITSASKNQDTLAYDRYRMVTNKITINAGGQDELFDYTTNNNVIRKSELSVDTTTQLTGTTYSKKDIEIINTSIYSKGLYETKTINSEQEFNTNISLVNNTNQTKTVYLKYQLYYYISNGATNPVDGNGNRAEEYVQNKTWTDQYAFAQNLCYGYSVADTNNRLTSAVKTSIVVGPYSMVKLIDSYTVSANLQTDISSVSESETTYYDVWTYLDVQVEQSNGKDRVENTPLPATANLAIETSVSGKTVTLSVKNNTNLTLTNIEISSFSIGELTKVVDNDNDYYKALEERPGDWIASYWKYYKRVKVSEGDDPNSEEDDTFEYIQLTSDPLAEQDENYFPNVPTYYEKTQQYYTSETNVIMLTPALHFSKTGDKITADNTVTLNHGESIVFATATTTQTSHVKVKGYATSSSVSSPSSVIIVNNGTDDAYLINHSENSYYVRFTGTINETDNFQVASVTINDVSYTHNYYIGVIRPGQIIPVSMKSKGEITNADLVLASGAYNSNTLTSAKWSSSAIQSLTKYFALVKTST